MFFSVNDLDKLGTAHDPTCDILTNHLVDLNQGILVSFMSLDHKEHFRWFDGFDASFEFCAGINIEVHPDKRECLIEFAIFEKCHLPLVFLGCCGFPKSHREH